MVIHFSQVVVDWAPFSQNKATLIGDRVRAACAMLCVTILAVKRAIEIFYSELNSKLNIGKKHLAFSHFSNSTLT